MDENPHRGSRLVDFMKELDAEIKAGEFELGQRVVWTYNSDGRSKTRIGTVEQVVLEGFVPDRVRFTDMQRKDRPALKPKKGLTYVIKSERKHYWVKAKDLSVATEQESLAERLCSCEKGSELVDPDCQVHGSLQRRAKVVEGPIVDTLDKPWDKYTPENQALLDSIDEKVSDTVKEETLDSIKEDTTGWVPFTEKDIKELIGTDIENPRKVLLTPEDIELAKKMCATFVQSGRGMGHGVYEDFLMDIGRDVIKKLAEKYK